MEHPLCDHVFEPEFTGPPPRPVPDALRDGPYARRRRAAMRAGFLSGAVCLALAQIPLVERLALYLLPLAYLDWLGLGVLAVTAVGASRHARRAGPYRYVRDGIPIAARVGFVAKNVETEYNGAPATHRFEVAAEVEDPESGEPVALLFASDGFRSDDRDAYDTPFRCGDLVTAVYLPGQFPDSTRLYPLLELNPAHSLRRAGARSLAATEAMRLGTILLVTSPFLVGLYGLRYWPLSAAPGPAFWAAGAASLAVGALFVGSIFWSHRRRLREVARRNAEALESGAPLEVSVPVGGSGRVGTLLKWMLVVGAPLVGAAIALPWFFLANAWLDASPARAEAVRIEGASHRTHAFVFREYRLDYAFESDPGSKRHFGMSPEELAAFTGEHGVARVRQGRLGWPWIETVVPVP